MKTTDTTHTPGPWSDTGHDGKDMIVIESQWGSIARVAYAGDYAQQVANSRLIAAAPDLLEALELIYANAGESAEWIRSRIAPAVAKATL